jgi:amino acid adenylation domain-containing protein
MDLTRDMSRSVLFDVMVMLQNNEVTGDDDQGRLDQLDVRPYGGRRQEASKFDLSFDFTEAGEELLLTVEYNSDIYEAITVSRMVDHLEGMMGAIVKDPLSAVGDLEYLSESERHELLVGFNDTQRSYPSDKTVVELFEEQAERTPENIAVVYGDRGLSYRELNERSNRLGNYLRERYAIRADDLIGIRLERSEGMIIGILGALKSGGAYVPVDPAYPEDRIGYMIKDSGCKVVIDEAEMRRFAGEESRYDSRDIRLVRGPGDLAYVIYTSGSTGQPKGVLIEHAGMLNHLFAMKDQLGLDAKSKIAQNASITFDISVWQLLNALITGGTTIIYDRFTILDPSEFIRRLEYDRITILQVVPSFLKAILDIEGKGMRRSLSSLKYLLVTGEAVSSTIMKKWFQLFPNIKAVNAYGPAEASDDVTLHVMSEAPPDGNVSIGKPIQNTRIYILDKLGKLCPAGVVGEIYVSGIGVGRGYLNDKEKSDYSFTIDPFIAEPGVRMYRTGDIGRWKADGNIEFIGRMDDQVKVRGYRIELSEIENALLWHPLIEEAAILAIGESYDDKMLVTFFVSKSKLGAEDLRGYLAGKIPMYMIPSFFVQLEVMPLNDNGKIDKKALAELERLNTDTELIYPENEIEQKLVTIWSDVLKIDEDRIGTKSSFFELGGHSLKVIKVLSKVHEQFNVKVDIGMFFKEPFIRALSKYIQAVSGLSVGEPVSAYEIFF